MKIDHGSTTTIIRRRIHKNYDLHNSYGAIHKVSVQGRSEGGLSKSVHLLFW